MEDIIYYFEQRKAQECEFSPKWKYEEQNTVQATAGNQDKFWCDLSQIEITFCWTGNLNAICCLIASA